MAFVGDIYLIMTGEWMRLLYERRVNDVIYTIMRVCKATFVCMEAFEIYTRILRGKHQSKNRCQGQTKPRLSHLMFFLGGFQRTASRQPSKGTTNGFVPSSNNNYWRGFSSIHSTDLIVWCEARATGTTAGNIGAGRVD